MIRKVFKQRLASLDKRSPGDFLDTVIRDMKVEDFLTAEFVVQMIFGLLFAMSDTISIMTTLTLKLLDDYPHVLEQLIVSSFFSKHFSKIRHTHTKTRFPSPTKNLHNYLLISQTEHEVILRKREKLV